MNFSGAEKRRPQMRLRSHTRGGLSVHILTISVTRLGCIVHEKNQTVIIQGVIRMVAYKRYWPPHYFSWAGGGGGEAQPPLL